MFQSTALQNLLQKTPDSWRLLVVLCVLLGLATVGTSQQPVDEQMTQPIDGRVNLEKSSLSGENNSPQTETGVPNLMQALSSTNAPANTPPQSGLLSQVGAAGDMIGFSHSDDSGTQTITLVHTGKSWIAVYHIDRSGKVRLVSSRPIDADFSLQLNATAPLPEEIREISRR